MAQRLQVRGKEVQSLQNQVFGFATIVQGF
jgi:hypothetical protein